MKECPQCKRTYADETITFCLVDGSILSAPYADVPPTQEAPAPTVRMPQTTKPQVPETIPAQLSPPPSPAVRRSERSGSIKIVIVLVVLLLGGVVALFALRTRRPNQNQQKVNVNISTSPSDQSQAETDSQKAKSETSRVTSPGPSPSPKSPVIKNPKLPVPAQIDADPKLFPSDPRSSKPTPGKGDEATDYTRVFAANEVSQKARILSKPEPQYTEEARKNQITGTVVLRAVFASSGQVTNIQPIKGLPDGLTERAIAAARQIKFTPAMKDGRAVSMYIQLEYNFNLY